MNSRYLKFILLAWLALGPLLGFAQDSLQIKLMQAIEKNDFKSVKKLVKAGADVNETVVSSSPNYLFFISQRLYLEGLSRGMKGEFVYVTPLHASADRANIKVLKYLKKKKANIEAGDSDGKTPLMYALRNPGGEEYALMLLKKGANFRAVDAAGNTALHYAAFGGNMEGVKMVIGGGVKMNACNNDSITPFLAAVVSSSTDFLKEMQVWEADLTLRDKDGMGALHYAAAYGTREKLSWIYEQAPELLNEAQNGYTPLDIAREAKNDAAIQYFKEKGGKYARYRYAEMVQAMNQRDHQKLRLILEDGANPNHKEAELPIIIAVENGDNVAVDLLIKAGANPNVLSSKNQSPIEIAVAAGHPAVALALLKAGSEADSRLIGTCMDQVSKVEHPGFWVDVVEEMASKVKDIDVAGGSLNIPALHYAAYLGQEGIIASLLKAGANVKTIDPEGWTALHWTVMKRDLLRLHLEKLRIAKVLIEAGADINAKASKPKMLPHTDPYLAKRIPAGATPMDILTYALPKDSDLDELFTSKAAKSGLTGENYLENGRHLAEKKDFQAALLEFNRALIQNPNLPEAYYERAKAKSMLSMYAEVERDLNQAIKFQPFYPTAFLYRGIARIKLGKPAAALSDINLAIKQGHDKGEALYWRGKCNLRLNKRPAACADFKKAGELGYQNGTTAVKLYCK